MIYNSRRLSVMSLYVMEFSIALWFTDIKQEKNSTKYRDLY